MGVKKDGSYKQDKVGGRVATVMNIIIIGAIGVGIVFLVKSGMYSDLKDSGEDAVNRVIHGQKVEGEVIKLTDDTYANDVIDGRVAKKFYIFGEEESGTKEYRSGRLYKTLYIENNDKVYGILMEPEDYKIYAKEKKINFKLKDGRAVPYENVESSTDTSKSLDKK